MASLLTMEKVYSILILVIYYTAKNKRFNIFCSGQ